MTFTDSSPRRMVPSRPVGVLATQSIQSMVAALAGMPIVPLNARARAAATGLTSRALRVREAWERTGMANSWWCAMGLWRAGARASHNANSM